MRKYLEYAIIVDAIIGLLLILSICFGKDVIRGFINVPSAESVEKLGVSLITVSATLVGFLLTIITVIVTFKKGFETEQPVADEDATVFDTKKSKEEQFYQTDLHKKVTNVFIHATYEVGIILFLLLLIQLNVLLLPQIVISSFTLISLILLAFAVARSFYIFQLFLRVHMN